MGCGKALPNASNFGSNDIDEKEKVRERPARGHT